MYALKMVAPNLIRVPNRLHAGPGYGKFGESSLCLHAQLGGEVLHHA